MGALLESGMVGNIGLKHLKVIKEDTINKWDKLGFLDGLKGHGRENIAQLYENQATHLINEATSSDSSGSFETVVFPIIRRVFSKLLANDIVSVQAMNLPIGKLFYFVPKVSSRDIVSTADSNILKLVGHLMVHQEQQQHKLQIHLLSAQTINLV